MTVSPGPRLLDAAALLAEVADELVVGTVRDTHLAWADRVHDAVRRPTKGASRVPELVHRGIAGSVYAGLGVGLRGASRGLGALAERDLGPGLEDTSRGRLVNAAVNGIIGDRLARERPRLAVPLAVRRDGRDVPLRTDALESAFPAATGRVALLLHGWSEDESAFDRHRDRLGTTYADTLAELGWTPVLLRANSGLSLRENGVALAALVEDLVEGWPVPVERLAFLGHSMGGLVIRAAGAVATDADEPWTDLPTDVITLGTPHLGAPLADGVGRGSRALGAPAGVRGVRPDPRPALGRGARPRRRPRRRGAGAAARALPPGLRDAQPFAAPPGRLRRWATCWCASPRRTARHRPASRPVPRAPTSCTCRAPGTSTCSTTRACTRAARWLARPAANLLSANRGPSRVEASRRSG